MLDRSMISCINLERDSVCAGDDAYAPHIFSLNTSECISVVEVLDLVKNKYLPQIYGANATWVALTPSGTPLAVIAQQWTSPKVLVKQTELPNTILLKYHAQVDPEFLFQSLVSGRAV